MFFFFFQSDLKLLHDAVNKNIGIEIPENIFKVNITFKNIIVHNSSGNGIFIYSNQQVQLINVESKSII